MSNAGLPLKTGLYAQHIEAQGKMVDFAGWLMPVNYGSQIDEHHAVRQNVGMFDVSHMTIIDVTGANAQAFLRFMVANDVSTLLPMQALYGALWNRQGGVVDDLIVYRLAQGYRCVVNASTRTKVLSWFDQHRMPDMVFAQQNLAMIAIQGPKAVAQLNQLAPGAVPDDLKSFNACTYQNWLIGRTGYTGEDGVEVMLPEDEAVNLWRGLIAAGVQPAGLGARDTLRLEAGLNLYGQDIDDSTSPLASNMGWTVAWAPADREFLGRDAIEPHRGRSSAKQVGVILQDKGVLRQGQVVTCAAGSGIITSGSYSPTLGCSIGLARMPSAAQGPCQVDIRGKLKQADMVKSPFVRMGKVLVG